MNLENKISNWLKLYLQNNSMKCFVVGISGGIDSALTSTLCAMTGVKTIVVTMPIHQNKNETNRGIKHIAWLKDNFSSVEDFSIDLSKTFNSMKESVPEKLQTKLSLANTRARIRMSTLYLIAGSKNGLVVGTGNKVEDFGIGFYTKYGDGGVDISPIADLMKSEVFSLSKKIGIIDEILDAKPTDGLWDDGRTDEEQIGVTYDELEWAMTYDGNSKLTSEQKKALNIYLKHRNNNIHKMIPIPIFKKKS
ncbi:MAG: NAD(+) synthase [Candidatus Marinimicrobia bacterium]|nr:NAD(+) synthase [Candidatus Neomarinimicrobiota bacterium]